MDGGTFTHGGLMHGREGLGLNYTYIFWMGKRLSFTIDWKKSVPHISWNNARDPTIY